LIESGPSGAFHTHPRMVAYGTRIHHGRVANIRYHMMNGLPRLNSPHHMMNGLPRLDSPHQSRDWLEDASWLCELWSHGSYGRWSGDRSHGSSGRSSSLWGDAGSTGRGGLRHRTSHCCPSIAWGQHLLRCCCCPLIFGRHQGRHSHTADRDACANANVQPLNATEALGHVGRQGRRSSAQTAQEVRSRLCAKVRRDDRTDHDAVASAAILGTESHVGWLHERTNLCSNG